ncbi:RDD family protein [uncultured Cohaesibacter sp.]|uniref:RDD family protein n=1 Tax=uncultured Cohaesibacter sp. TaxID=1002546 RepID=UPI0029C85476|nr:RDD family protein [uncultured Cohaesibacter sp.]
MTPAETAHDHTSDRQQAFDPAKQPALFDGILSRRALAFLFDAFMICILMIVFSLVIAVLGIVTLGLGFLLYAILFPVTALGYAAVTLGSYKAATPGMRLMGLEMRLWYGAKPYALLAIMHSLLFWVAGSILTPFVLLVGLFTSRKQLLHDIVLGTVVIDRDALRELEQHRTFQSL